MNVIGNRRIAQTNFHKPHCRSEHYSPPPFNDDAGAHCAPYVITDADELPNPFTQMKPSR